MPPTQNQASQGQNQPTIQDDQLAAALGFLTTISELHMGMGQPQDQQQNGSQQPTDQQNQPQQAQQQSQTPPEASKQPQEAPEQQKQEDQRDAAMEKEIADIRAELEKLQKEVGDTESPSEDKNEQAAGTTEDTESQG